MSIDTLVNEIENRCDKNLKYFNSVVDFGLRNLPTERDRRDGIREFGNRQFRRGLAASRDAMYSPGASGGVLRNDWARSTKSATSVIRDDFSVICARAEYGYRTDAIIRRAVNILAYYLVGQGNKPHPAIKDVYGNGIDVDGLNRCLAADWEIFNDEGVRTGPVRMTVYQMQLMSCITTIVYGSSLKTVVQSRKGSLLPFAFQLLKPTRLDFSRDTFVDSEMSRVDGATLHGMRLNQYGEATGFYFENESEMRSADNVLLSFLPIEAEQYLGLSWLIPVLPAGFDRQQLMTDKLKQSRIGARLGYKLPQSTQQGIEGLLETDNNGNSFFELDFQGFFCTDGEVKPIPITDPISETFEPLMRMILQEIALGLGFSYQMLSSDLKDANFTSGRLNKLVDSRFFKSLWKQHTKIDDQPVYDKFVEWEVVSGRTLQFGLGPEQYYRDMRRYNNCYWLAKDGDEWLEPLKDAQATLLKLKAGIWTFEDVCAKESRNYIDVLDKHVECRDAMKARGLDALLPEVVSAAPKATDTSNIVQEVSVENNE